MCIVFLAFWPTPDANRKYRLVLAANRDEVFDRPSKPAHLWEDGSGIVAGVDMTVGKEGGTWAGVADHSGRFAVITNVRQSPDDIKPDAKGRGGLVADFLRGSQSPLDYATSVAETGDEYNGFNLLVGDMCDGSLCYYGNKTGDAPRLLKPGIYGLSNASLDTPWRKLTAGKACLSTILVSDGGAMELPELQDKLFAMLSDKTCYHPDPLLPTTGLSEEVVQTLSSVYVCCPRIAYGTRAQTIVTVGTDNKVVFKERSLVCPIELASLQWKTSEFTFPMGTSGVSRM